MNASSAIKTVENLEKFIIFEDIFTKKMMVRIPKDIYSKELLLFWLLLVKYFHGHIILEIGKKWGPGKFGSVINIIKIKLSLANLLCTIVDILQKSGQILFDLFQWKSTNYQFMETDR